MAEEKKIATGYIGNALRSSAADHTTTFADEIFDTERQKYQNEVNTDLEQALEAEKNRAEAAEEANAQAIAEEKAAIMGTDRIADGAITIEKLADIAIDNEPTAGSDNLVKSGGAYGISAEQFSCLLSMSEAPLFNGWIDSSNKIVNYNQSKFCIIAVKGGDVVTKAFRKDSQVMIVKSFDFGYKLPYTPNYAAGETGRRDRLENFELPGDAKYLLLSVINNVGDNVIPNTLTINGVDYLFSLRKTINDYIISTNNNIHRIDDNIFKAYADNNISFPIIELLPSVKGHLDSSKKIVEWENAEHKCIRINGGDRIVLKGIPSNTSYAFVKTFDIYATNNYSLDFATGETGIHDIKSTSFISVTAPEDATYIVFRSKDYAGRSNEFTYLNINGVDYFNSVEKNIGVNKFLQKNDIKINNLYTNIPGYQGMCTIDGILCSAISNGIYVKGEDDVLIGSVYKAFGINTHNNDIDYCEYTDTLITAILPDDGGVMQICLLQNAKQKLYSVNPITDSDWLKIIMPQELDEGYIMVSNCFGESCDIVYCLLIDRVVNYTNTNKRFLKVKLGLNSDGTYDGTYTILRNESWPYKIEIQGSKYCNGKLYVSTDDFIGTRMLHSSVTVIDVESLQTIEHICYRNQSEINDSVEAEGLSFINDKLYQIVIISPNGNHAARFRQLREFDRFNL